MGVSLVAERAVGVLERLLRELDRGAKTGLANGALPSADAGGPSQAGAGGVGAGAGDDWSIEKWLAEPVSWEGLLDPNLGFDFASGSFWSAGLG